MLEGLSVQDPKTNETLLKMMDQEDNLLLSFPYENSFYEMISSGERVILRSGKNWFLRISDALKMKCFDELSTIRFMP